MVKREDPMYLLARVSKEGRGGEMEDRGRSSRGEDLCRSSGEGEGWKTVVDLPGEKT